ncbi:MAG: FKBP-type peptidyl-prolyl cis-trans isomerase [Tannerella sp.]|jgi:FKBP-type peptidyl-prolyl cis-trans isomerase SlyD|nr:FKBP-type peptidyl-prolyl cis-trans isomerase [Tannerella sp.]
MKITKNKFVSLTYDLYAGEESDRELMESATRERPLSFIYGLGSMLELFEKNISQLEPGDKFNFTLAPAEAYGEYVQEHVVELPKKVFEINGKFNDAVVKEGATLPMMDSNGGHINGSVLEIKDDVVVMDFNHPLAGETLNFIGEVIDVHEPTEQEIAEMNKAMRGGCGCNCDECDDCDDDGCGDDCDCHKH